MKKILSIILCLSLFTFFTSCGKPTLSDYITSHVWLRSDYFDRDNYASVDFMKFNSDGTGETSSKSWEDYKEGDESGENIKTFTWRIKDNTLTMKQDSSEIPLVIKYVDVELTDEEIKKRNFDVSTKGTVEIEEDEFYVSEQFLMFANDSVFFSSEFFNTDFKEFKKAFQKMVESNSDD